MEFLKKSTLGRLVTAEGGADNPGLAEVRLTAEEYRRLCEECQSLIECQKELEQEVERQKLRMQEIIETQYGRCQSDLKSRQEEFDRMKEELERKNDRLRMMAIENQRDLELQKDLNWNLKRILREKANAKRGLTPKKLHSGYNVLFSSQYKEMYRDHMVRKPISTWKSTIQKYYDASISLEDIEKDIWTELSSRVLVDMGITVLRHIDKYGKDVFEEYHDECVLYRYEYRANYKSGLWEVIIWTTKALSMAGERC